MPVSTVIQYSVMQPQENSANQGPGEQLCAQCGSPMPKEMRFCRSCGNRLGEGPAEYTETVRFPGTTAPNRGGQTTPFYPTFNAPMTTFDRRPRRRGRMGFAGTTWLWIALVAFFGMGGVMSLVGGRHSVRPPSIAFNSSRSYVGVDDFQTTDGGATFADVEPPGSPADKAGLVGGDIVTSFDGHPIKEANDVMDLLGNTPIGKTVEVIYIRDGNFHNTQLTTISRDEYNRLDRAYSRRPEGYGKFGFPRNRMTRVNIPETKTFGVQINSVDANGPADLFGIKVGDIITDFDNVPIRTPDEFYMRVRRTIPYTTVNITLLREGQKMVIPVKIGKA
ncbi:MAG TPA: PDZ domain-containing protein [Pyrinomonadaceae bacterium]|nr:PDZ domain-containing protein [Pyrinomonadaceae bacterium]